MGTLDERAEFEKKLEEKFERFSATYNWNRYERADIDELIMDARWQARAKLGQSQ